MRKELRQKVFDKFGGLCAYTGKPLENDWQVDHIKSKKRMRKYILRSLKYREEIKKELKRINDLDNLLPAIPIVNHYKRSLSLKEFRERMSTLHIRLGKLPKNPYAQKSIARKKYLLKVAELFDIDVDRPFSGKFYFETLE